MLRVLGRATSGNVQKVLFFLEETKTPYEREDYGRLFGNTTTDAYAKLNPTRKVPTLIDGDVVVWDSNTILRYLAAKSGSALYPTELGARSEVERWMDWLHASLNAPYLAGFREAKKPEGERSMAVGKDIAAELQILEGQVAAHGWVAGPQFSLADIALGPIVVRCLAFPLGMPAFPALTAWCGRLSERPSFATATAVS
jgi:glutathione S-transferase